MSAGVGWTLAVVATALSYLYYQWAGVGLALSVIVFWLLLQFSRAIRVMRLAAQAPVGQVPSAVMLHAKLAKGMRLMSILLLTRSLGERVKEDPETFVWRDDTGACVTVELLQGKVTQWHLQRSDAAPGDTGPGDPAAK